MPDAATDRQPGTRRRPFREDFRRACRHAVTALLPTILTLFIIVKILEFVDWNISRYIRSGMLYVAYQALGAGDVRHLVPAGTAPADLYHAFYNKYTDEWYVVVLSFLVAVLCLYLVGFLLASVVGRWFTRLLEAGFLRLPGVRSVYPYVKQVTDIVFTSKTNIKNLNRVVAVEYPRKGMYSIGLVVASGVRSINEKAQGEYLTVFLPCSPTPVTGYAVLVKAEEVIDLPLTVEQVLMWVVSCGVITPPKELVTFGDRLVVPQAPALGADARSNPTDRPGPSSISEACEKA